MKTVTIILGNSDNKLTQQDWANYVKEIQQYIIEKFALKVEFFGGSPSWLEWQNAATVFRIDEEEIPQTIAFCKECRKRYHQESIAWIVGDTEFI